MVPAFHPEPQPPYMGQPAHIFCETGRQCDATQGRKTKSVLVMENSQVVLSALLPETIAGRAQALWPEEEKEDREDAE